MEENEETRCQECGSVWTKIGQEINGQMVWWCSDHDPTYVYSYEERQEMLKKVEALEDEAEENPGSNRSIEISHEFRDLLDEIYRRNNR